MKINLYARRKRQLKNLSKKLNSSLAIREEENTAAIQQLMLKIKRIIKELKHVLSFVELKKIMGGAAVCLPLLLSNGLSAQQYAPVTQNPFGLMADSNNYDLGIADLDGDGDFDVLMGTVPGALHYYQNTGSATNPVFAAPVNNPFGLDSAYFLPAPAFADLDNDGDMDLVCGDYFGAMEFYENTGSATNPQFAAKVVNPFGMGYTFFYSNPAFTDLDNDGDLDIVTGQYGGDISYMENTGSASNPMYDTLQAGPFGLDTFYFNLSPTVTDLDGDGDFDILAGEYYGDLLYYQNNGTAMNPQFSDPMPNPFGLTGTSFFPNPQFADLDGDGDQDILSVEFGGAINYFEYTDPTSIQSLSVLEDALIYPNPVNDFFMLRTTEQIDEVEVVDVNGRTVSLQKDLSGQYDVSQLGSGVYFVLARVSGKEFFAGKLVK